MNRPTSQTPQVSATRRTVIRAGFAVPALSTVASGSALAATSATCFAKRLASPVYPGVSSSANPDTFMRVQLGKLTTTSGVSYYVDGAAVATKLGSTIRRGASYTLTTGQFQRFDVPNNLEVPGVVSTLPTGTYTQASGQYVALRFDTSGKVVGVGAGSAGTSAVQFSCWSSLAP